MHKFYLAVLVITICLCGGAGFPPILSASEGDPDAVILPVPSSSAQKLYGAAKSDLLQLRVLLKNGRSQSSVGSGFFIGKTDRVITNYHVVSQVVLEPETYVAEFVDTNGERGSVELIAVDALRDLALVRVSREGNGFFNVPDKLPVLTQGQYLYSLGNPLDLGFAISEGAYNGVIKRSFYEQLMFTGPINAGMSGGPSVTVDGRLAGVNVSKRLDGELVSFLVPVRYVKELIEAADANMEPAKDFMTDLALQLTTYQAVMVEQLTGEPLTLKDMGPYRVPVRESDQMRCWGRSMTRQSKTYTQDRISCKMETSLYISNRLRTGWMSIDHTYTQSDQLGPLKFTGVIESSFGNQIYSYRKHRSLTGFACAEQFVDNGSLPMRAVICVRAYHKFAEIYDFTVLSTSTDESLRNVTSRMDIKGVSYENGLKVSRLFLESIGREDTP